MVTVGDTTSTWTDPFGQISTFSLAVMLPFTFPRTTTSLARIWAWLTPSDRS